MTKKATPGTPPDPSQLVDVPRLMTAYYTRHPDVAALAHALQEAGAKAFVDSWKELMQRIASKSAALAA